MDQVFRLINPVLNVTTRDNQSQPRAVKTVQVVSTGKGEVGPLEGRLPFLLCRLHVSRIEMEVGLLPSVPWCSRAW